MLSLPLSDDADHRVRGYEVSYIKLSCSSDK